MALVTDLDKLLPQTQCGECSYAGCLPYAQAMASGLASIDRCPPGGVKTLKALAEALKIDHEPYVKQVEASSRQPSVAKIRENECIGCTKCIQACPVDAIIGTAKQMHAVIVHECTGCGLCVDPCPVDCIDILPLPEPVYDKEQARQRYHAKQNRLLRDEHEKQQSYREKRLLAKQTHDHIQDKKAKQDYILQALARVGTKKINE